MDTDSARICQTPAIAVQPIVNYESMLLAQRVLSMPGTWVLNQLLYMECNICGKAHMAKACEYKMHDDVPKDFCIMCLLPIWPIDGIERVHHPTELGKACTNAHRPSSRCAT